MRQVRYPQRFLQDCRYVRRRVEQPLPVRVTLLQLTQFARRNSERLSHSLAIGRVGFQVMSDVAQTVKSPRSNWNRRPMLHELK